MQEYSSFFDEDSGNSSIGDSLNQIIDYIKEENTSYKTKLGKLQKEIQYLVTDSKKESESYKNNLKRDMSTSDTDTQNKTDGKKKSLNDDGDDNNR